MLKAAQETKIDPIFAIIEAHRQAATARFPVAVLMCKTEDAKPEYRLLKKAHDKLWNIETAATVKLRRARPTTSAGIAAALAYYVEHKERHPDWIGGESKPKRGTQDFGGMISFETNLIRNLASAALKVGILVSRNPSA